MKLSIAMLFLCTGVIFAEKSYSQSVLLTLDVKNQTVQDVLDEIERQSDFHFFYNNRQINTARIVSIKSSRKDVFSVLNLLFRDTGVRYSVIDRSIILSVETLPERPQQTPGRTVSGRVTDTDGEPVIGANVTVRGSSTGAITDINGAYSLSGVPENAVLVFSYIGMTTREVPAGNDTRITVSLEESAIGLQEVVAIGYGTARKATVTGSVTSVKGAEVIKAPVTNTSNALVGLLPGLSSTQRTGEPGNDAASIHIRGVNTLGNNSALIVVDGIPERSLERIDPASIESITILKDASAAIYGSQSANGVILVTTKRGIQGKPEVVVNYNQGFNQPTRIPQMASAAEYATMLNEIDLYRGNNPRYTPEQIRKFRDGSDPWSYPDTDWFAEVLKSWSAQNYLNASLSGGNEKWKYYLSLGTKSQDGYYKNSATKYSQHDFRSNIDGEISGHVKIKFDVAGRMEDKNYSTRNAGAIFRMLMRGKPIYPGFWPDGTPGPDLEYGDNPVVVSTDATGYDRDKKYVLNSNLRLDIEIPWIKGLRISGNASFDKDFRFRKRFETPWYLYSWDGKTYDAGNNPVLIKGKKGFEDPRLQEWMEDNQTVLLNGIVDYSANFGLHGIKAMTGVESRSRSGDNFNAYRRYFISTSIDELFAGGDKDKTNNGSSFENARLNYFGRLNYNYAEKYLFEFVWRYDGSYIFPRKGRFGFFPGVSLGWRISEEHFWKEHLSFISNFKLRGSWGQTGNDRIDEWQYLSSYAFHSSGYTYIFGTDQENKLLSERRIPNKDITWEVANQSNIGFETYLLENRLSFEADVFYNKRSNILWQRNASVPTSTGLTLPRENIGKVTNKGFEFNLGYRNKIEQFKYTLSFNGGYAANKITYWDEAPGRPEWQRSTGKPIPSNPSSVDSDLYYEAIGIFKDQAAVEAYPHWPGARPGDIIFNDVDGNGVIDANDRIRNDRTGIPKFTGGLNFNVTYLQFDLSILFQGASGAVRYIRTESGEVGNFLKEFYDERWTEENPDSKGPRSFIDASEYWRNYNNTFFLHKTDYIRLKNLELGYSLPGKINAKLGIKNLRFYVNGYNLLTYSPYLRDFDPETNQTNGQSYPVQRVVNGGITLTF
ncbi:MAG: TonB-dependent receptor [Tannerellaceae bacterium]|jgi:TonB-linked SusC/RagA family outer membrane protein|nr:TonB-dependent receptor [Tannerellaceae bacterium]